MGEIFIEGLPFTIQIEGDAPNKDEARRILKLVERLDTVKDTGEEALRELEDQYGFNIPLLDEAMISEEKKNAINLLDDFGFVDKKELSPLEKLLLPIHFSVKAFFSFFDFIFASIYL